MSAIPPKHGFDPQPAPPKAISAPESARYTSDMLESLRKIASGQGHELLAHLLDLARVEAKSLAGTTKDST